MKPRSLLLVVAVCLSAWQVACGGGGGGTVTQPPPPPPAPTVTISANPTSVTEGSSTTLNWSCANSTSATASASPAESDWSGSESTSGTKAVTPGTVGTETYSLSCTGDGGTATNSAKVTVNAPVSVSLSPASATVSVNGTEQFTAAVSNATDTSVTWTVNGVAGGSTAAGTISSSGLYTAPASVPNPATVTVTVTSIADATKSASAQVSIINPVPQIGSISPGAVAPGYASDFTLTVTGTGFVSSSAVQLNGSGVSTTVNGSTSLSVTVPSSDVAAAGQIAVTVVNPTPGGGTSNQVNLAVASSASASSVASLEIQDSNPNDLFGMKVKDLGNITGVPGLCDHAVAIIAAYAYRIYVVCNPENHSGVFTSSQIGTAALPGFQIVYNGPGTGAFFNVAAGGSIDGSGIDDLVVSLPSATTDTANDPGAGTVFAIQGGSWLANLMTTAMGNNAIPTIDLNDNTLPIVRMQGVAAYNAVGQSLADGKDFDKDGFTDIAFGAPGYGYNATYNAGPGAVYLIYGGKNFFSQKSLDLSQIGTAFRGAIITRSPSTPISMAAGLGSAFPDSDTVKFAGDLTGDGLPELLIGDPAVQNTTPNTQKVYAVFGTGALSGTYYVEDIGQTFDGATYLTDESGCSAGTGGLCYQNFGYTVDGRDGSVMLSTSYGFIVNTTAAGTVFVSQQTLSNGETIDIRTAASNLQATNLWDYSTDIEDMGFAVKDGSDFRLIGAPGPFIANDETGKVLLVGGNQLPGGNINVATVVKFTITGDQVHDLFGFSLDRTADGSAILVGARSFTNYTNGGKFYYIPVKNLLF